MLAMTVEGCERQKQNIKDVDGRDKPWDKPAMMSQRYRKMI
jgi:hypothetical protein